MERKEQLTQTPAGRVSQQSQEGGVAMRREIVNEKFDNKHGVLYFQAKFYSEETENNFVVDFSLVRRKKTANLKRFQNLPDCKPIAVFNIVRVDYYSTGITVEEKAVIEYYKIGECFVILSYPKVLPKDYLLIINNTEEKIRIPKPKEVDISFECEEKTLRWRMWNSGELEKVLRKEKDLSWGGWRFHKLVYIDQELKLQPLY